MAKYCNPSMLDQGLKYLYEQVTPGAYTNVNLCVCSAQPTTHTEAETTYKLDIISMTPGSDFTLANGDVSGRKVTVAEKTGTVDTGGTATHVALTATIGAVNTLLYVTTCTSQVLTATNSVTVPAWDVEIEDPT